VTFSDPVEAETRVVEMVVWIDHARVSTNARGLDGEFRADKVHRNGDGHDYFAVSCRLDGVKYGYEPDEVDPAVSLIGKVATIKQGEALAEAHFRKMPGTPTSEQVLDNERREESNQ
jgi:hypothetical protein